MDVSDSRVGKSKVRATTFNRGNLHCCLLPARPLNTLGTVKEGKSRVVPTTRPTHIFFQARKVVRRVEQGNLGGELLPSREGKPTIYSTTSFTLKLLSKKI